MHFIFPMIGMHRVTQTLVWDILHAKESCYIFRSNVVTWYMIWNIPLVSITWVIMTGRRIR